MPRKKKAVGTITINRYAGFDINKLPLAVEESALVLEPEQITVREFLTEPARVEIERGMSIQIAVGDVGGEWQTVRVRVSMPCYVEEVEQATAFAALKAQEELARQRMLIFGAAADMFNMQKPAAWDAA